MGKSNITRIENYITFKYGQSVLRLRCEDIEYIENNDQNTTLQTQTKTFKLSKFNIDEIISSLPEFKYIKENNRLIQDCATN